MIKSELSEKLTAEDMDKEKASADDEVDEDSRKKEAEDARAVHLEKEAKLNAYLETLKPKQRSIKEMLMSMPGYKNIASLKPKIGGGEDKKSDFIFLDAEVDKKRMSKRQQQIEALKNRYVKHALAIESPKAIKGEHVKLRIQKKEEDSQGIEHLVENEVDYIRNPLNEEEEAILPTELPLLKLSLREQIHKKKMENYNELVKQAAYDNEEDDDDGGEKNNGDDDEELDDEEEIEDSDLEEEEEEELEYLLGGNKKKKKKCRLIDDEAEDEDENAAADDEDDDDDDDSDSSDDEEDENLQPDNNKSNPDSENRKLIDEDSLSVSTDLGDKESNNSKCATPTPSTVNTPLKKQSENDISCVVDYTPKLASAAMLIQRGTQSDFWLSSNTNVSNRHSDEASQLIPESHKTDVAEDKAESENIASALADIISEPKSKFDDLVDLCSGKFVSQVKTGGTALHDEVDDDDDEEFGNFDFGDDELMEGENKVEKEENSEDRSEIVKTPVATSIRHATVVDGITPKLTVKPNISRRSMQFDMKPEHNVDHTDSPSPKKIVPAAQTEDSDDEEVFGRRKSVGKQKRLQFSDDEDDGNDMKVDESMISSDEEDGDQQLEETHENIEEEILPEKNLFFNKFGRLKRKFVEDEAELSGSDEGSADEDERGMNRYEMEEGDDEEIDEDEAKEVAGRAHLKQMLIDDDRALIKIKDKYLPDGELFTEKQRERKLFRFGIDLNDDAHMGGSDEEDVQPENPEEVARKQAWVEKRKWMSENSHLLEIETDESQSLLTSFKIGKKSLQKIESFIETSTSDSADVTNIVANQRQRKSIYEEIIRAKKAVRKSKESAAAIEVISSSSTTCASNSVPMTSCSEGLNFATVGGIGKKDSQSADIVDNSSITKSMSQPLFGVGASLKITSTSKKGSFLSRGSMMLAKLAETTKTGDTVSNVKNNSRNFVFSHITPPNVEKVDGSTSRVKRALNKTQAKKIKVDRSFHNLDEASKGSSVFKFL